CPSAPATSFPTCPSSARTGGPRRCATTCGARRRCSSSCATSA
ncbi:MAG: hypothetical protein AVDCRST_MAG30-2139, partial [uncultured Solirubrobacteraceae bacterium]